MHQISDSPHFVTRKHFISVGVFQGCATDSIPAEVNDLAVKIMEENSIKVTNISNRSCCNEPAHHTGKFDQNLERAMEDIEAGECWDFDYIVNTPGDCGRVLKEYDKLFVPGTNWYDRAKAFTGKVRDISEIMEMIDFDFKHEINRSAVYHPSCHREDVQQIFEEPLNIIRRVPGLNHIEDVKIENIKQSGADLIITSHPEYHAQMKPDDGLEVKHLVEVVAEACGVGRD